MQTIPVSLVDKYRPQSIRDLILPPAHGLALSLQFLDAPYPAAFLHHGKSGLGKSSIAEIMARVASRNPLNIRRYAGPDVTSDVVREIANSFSTPSLYDGLYSVIVNEADAIPRVAQIRLLDLMDKLREHHLVLLLTSNDELPDFDSRFLSRTRPQLFTSQGLAPRARDWLLKIAVVEGIPLERREASRIVKLSKNNLRTCLQSLEFLGAERRVMAPASDLPDVTAKRHLANKRQSGGG